MRVITFIMGALLVVGGIYCMFAPIATYAALSWLIGIAMVAEGVGCVVIWSDLRKRGLASAWTLVGAIISIVLGVFLLGSFAAQVAMDFFIAFMIAAWLIIAGVTRVIAAFSARGLQSKTGTNEVSWVGLLILGILTVVLGILCFFNPLAVMASVGLLLGISIVCVGAGLIARGIRMD